jgi:hypothetical protein
MTEPPEQPPGDDRPVTDGQFEDYLDGLLDGAQRAAAERVITGDSARRLEAHLQSRIDASLTRLFRVEAPSEQVAAAAIAAAAPPVAGKLPFVRSTRWGWIAAAGAAAAAAIAWMLVGNPFGQRESRELAFAVRPLPDLYREALANGFEPAYNCSQAERFADTFDERQGHPLKLLKLPDGVRMLGLAYPGGLSRDTTAMLCRVDGKPVMVFVDRESADNAEAQKHCDKSVHMFRVERDGLVFYEVTPLEGPRVIEYLAPLSAPGASELPSA